MTTTHITSTSATITDIPAMEPPMDATQALLHNPETWITLAFVVFVVLAAKFLVPVIGRALDARADKIRDQLEQASRLRAEAQALLETYQKQQDEKLKEAEAILVTAQRDADLLRARAAEDLKQALARRTQQAEEKIARAEAEAVAAIRTKMIDMATDTARETIAAQLQTEDEDPAITRALAAIGSQIH